MPRSVKFNINVDKLRLCYRQPPHLFKYLADVKAGTFVQRDGYKLHILGSDDPEETPVEELTKLIVNVVLDNNTLLGQFTFHKTRKYEGKCFFSFHNKALYTVFNIVFGNRSNLVHLLDYVADDLGLELNNITELELAVDSTTNTTAKIRKMISHYEEYEMIYNGKNITDPNRKIENYSEQFGRSRARLERTPTLYFKQAKDDAPVIRCYDKTREQEEKDNAKEHISEWNGFGKLHTHRIEVRLRNSSIKEFLSDAPVDYWRELQLFLVNLQEAEFRGAIWLKFTDRMLYFRNKATGQVVTLADLI